MTDRPSIFPQFGVNIPMPPVAPPKPSAAQVEALASAMWQLLDDMGENGTCVCGYAKALARVAYEPFLQADFASDPDLEPDYAPHMTLAAAQAIIADVER